MASYPQQPTATLDPSMVTTALELPGYRIVRNIGVVRGIVVRSRNLFGTIGAGLQTLIGGNITLYTQLCEKTRQDAFVMMAEHAAQAGANAVIMRPLRRQRADAGRHRSPRLRHRRRRAKTLAFHPPNAPIQPRCKADRNPVRHDVPHGEIPSQQDRPRQRQPERIHPRRMVQLEELDPRGDRP